MNSNGNGQQPVYNCTNLAPAWKSPAERACLEAEALAKEAKVTEANKVPSVTVSTTAKKKDLLHISKIAALVALTFAMGAFGLKEAGFNALINRWQSEQTTAKIAAEQKIKYQKEWEQQQQYEEIIRKNREKAPVSKRTDANGDDMYEEAE